MRRPRPIDYLIIGASALLGSLVGSFIANYTLGKTLLWFLAM